MPMTGGGERRRRGRAGETSRGKIEKAEGKEGRPRGSQERRKCCLNGEINAKVKMDIHDRKENAVIMIDMPRLPHDIQHGQITMAERYLLFPRMTAIAIITTVAYLLLPLQRFCLVAPESYSNHHKSQKHKLL